MGWVIFVRTEKAITTDDLQRVVERLPPQFGPKFDKQSWGWPCYGDINLPTVNEPNEFSLTGSYLLSGEHAFEFSDSIVEILNGMGINSTRSKFDEYFQTS